MDSEALKDLLATLRAQQSGDDTSSRQDATHPIEPTAGPSRRPAAAPHSSNDSSCQFADNQELSSLLSSLQPIRTHSGSSVPEYEPCAQWQNQPTEDPSWIDAATRPTKRARLAAHVDANVANVDSNMQSSGKGRQKDLTQLTFTQALPILSRLVNDRAFLEAFTAMKYRQDELELSLLDERNRLKSEWERTIKVAIKEGRPASQVEQHRRSLKNGLDVFDRGALTRWDGHRQEQQKALRELGVPTFLASTDSHILQRQRQVLGVLVDAMNEDGKEENDEAGR